MRNQIFKENCWKMSYMYLIIMKSNRLHNCLIYFSKKLNTIGRVTRFLWKIVRNGALNWFSLNLIISNWIDKIDSSSINQINSTGNWHWLFKYLLLVISISESISVLFKYTFENYKGNFADANFRGYGHLVLQNAA